MPLRPSLLRRLAGLSSNPVFCDCNARALQRWLQDKVRSADDLGDLGEVRVAFTA